MALFPERFASGVAVYHLVCPSKAWQIKKGRTHPLAACLLAGTEMSVFFNPWTGIYTSGSLLSLQAFEGKQCWLFQVSSLQIAGQGDFFVSFLFETGLHCVALTVPELAVDQAGLPRAGCGWLFHFHIKQANFFFERKDFMWPRLASNSCCSREWLWILNPTAFTSQTGIAFTTMPNLCCLYRYHHYYYGLYVCMGAVMWT